MTPWVVGWAFPSAVIATLPPGVDAIACSSPAVWGSSSAAGVVASSHNSCLPSCAQENIPVEEVVVVVAAVVVVATAVVVSAAAGAAFFSIALDDICTLPPLHACKLHYLVVV